MRKILLSLLAAGTCAAQTPPTHPPLPDKVAEIDMSMAALTAGNTVVLNGYLEGTNYYFTITFRIDEIKKQLTVPKGTPQER